MSGRLACRTPALTSRHARQLILAVPDHRQYCLFSHPISGFQRGPSQLCLWPEGSAPLPLIGITARSAASADVSARAESVSGHTDGVEVYESDGRRFEMVLASDVVNDGMGLELTELSPGSGSSPVLEASWHNDGTSFDFLCHGAVSLPFDVVQRFVAAARSNLPPTD